MDCMWLAKASHLEGKMEMKLDKTIEYIKEIDKEAGRCSPQMSIFKILKDIAVSLAIIADGLEDYKYNEHHAAWVEDGDVTFCGNCGRETVTSDVDNFCPSCGARMDMKFKGEKAKELYKKFARMRIFKKL